MSAPSLKINVLASYTSQIYLVIISIAILPIYMKYMGAEAYGLVGFFAMLQGLFSLLDFGLTPTISRQTALYNAGAETALGFRQLFRSLSAIFTTIASRNQNPAPLVLAERIPLYAGLNRPALPIAMRHVCNEHPSKLAPQPAR